MSGSSTNPRRSPVFSVGAAVDSLVRLLRFSLLVVGLLAASGLTVLVASPRLQAGEVRGALTASEVTSPDVGAVEIVGYPWFLPVGGVGRGSSSVRGDVDGAARRDAAKFLRPHDPAVPGRVRSEPGDDGLSRASFPFTLGSPPDRQFDDRNTPPKGAGMSGC